MSRFERINRNMILVKFPHLILYLQLIPVDAVIALPKLKCSQTNLNFQCCCIGQESQMEFHIYNHTVSKSSWRIRFGKPLLLRRSLIAKQTSSNHDSDNESQGFAVSAEGGVISPKSTENYSAGTVHVLVSFRPK